MLKLNGSLYFFKLFFYIYLNTSHVKVKQIVKTYWQQEILDLNTSHVKVKPFSDTIYMDNIKFKYISC